jgi:hypothetical protein
MKFINKTFKNKITGESFTIIDQYQNVAITSNKEKIDVNILSNDKIFVPVKNNTVQTMNENFEFPKKQKEDIVDPNRFFDNQNTYNAFADKIKNVDLSKIPDDENKSLNMLTSNITNESAIIMADPEDEVEEIKRKYGATSVDDSVKRQNEIFSKILDPESNQANVQQVEAKREFVEPQQTYVEPQQTYVEPQQTYVEPPIQRIEVQDPIISMFKNVKRNLDFKINLKVDGKIPRLDFIEMMEDSYDISIIDYLADEFTNKILSDPSIIRNKVKDEIKSMIDVKNGHSNKESEKLLPVPSQVTKKENSDKKKDRVLNEGLPTPVKSRRKPVVKKPTPPPTQIIPEGKDPIETKNMSV